MTERCDAHHDGHDCREPGACQRALSAMCDRIEARAQDEQRPERTSGTREAA